MTKIGVQLIYGSNPEPFLEAALSSVSWADYVVAVNTAPTTPNGRGNEAVVRRVVPEDKLRTASINFLQGGFDFAGARNVALELADVGDYVLLLDADMVHFPEFEAEARMLVAGGADMVKALFYHLCVYRDLVHSIQDREILFEYTPGLRFVGQVHESPDHPRKQSCMAATRFVHYGYVKPAREVAARWEFYRSLGSEVHEYDVSQPDKALDAWPEICERHFVEHPPAAQSVIENYPIAPAGAGRCRIGLVLLTWDDADNLREMLPTLGATLEPFELMVVDNGSTDGSAELITDCFDGRVDGGGGGYDRIPGLSLAEALNIGFGHFLDREDLDYIGWIHPDHVFIDPEWLTRLRIELDQFPHWAKLGAQEVDDPNTGLRPGNTQCFLIRRSALEQIGLFDEAYIKCGGYEDWDMNRRLIDQVGQVMISPNAKVRHKAMETRRRHDNLEAGQHNAGVYVRKWDTHEPPV